jgi:hypothetical protein
MRNQINLSVKAASIGGVLFCLLYFACQLIFASPLALTDLEVAIWAIFLLVGPVVAFIGSIIPTIVGGKILTILLTKWLQSNNLKSGLEIILGIVVGGLFGYILVQLVEWGTHFSRFTVGPSCGLLSGALAGAGAGVWYAWKITVLLRKNNSTLLG